MREAIKGVIKRGLIMVPEVKVQMKTDDEIVEEGEFVLDTSISYDDVIVDLKCMGEREGEKSTFFAIDSIMGIDAFKYNGFVKIRDHYIWANVYAVPELKGPKRIGMSVLNRLGYSKLTVDFEKDTFKLA